MSDDTFASASSEAPSLAADQDLSFVFDYRALDGPDYDLDDDQRLSTYWDVEPLCRGPQPPPEWLVTDRAAVDTDLGVLKSGKEADVVVLERAVPRGDACLLAAKRYRTPEHRTFHRSAGYTEGRRLRNTRDARAMRKGSSWGREVAGGQWAAAEWEALNRLHAARVPVPYPVQLDGTELLMELLTVDGEAAPRLAQTRPGPTLLASWFDQLREAMATLARLGLAHGDLSAYNVMAAGERLVLIDLPQVVDLVANPNGGDYLLRDCHNVCTWFSSRGLAVDEQELYAELLVAAFG